jgi:transcription-repair coupling factor (superfamily II helicase)
MLFDLTQFLADSAALAPVRAGMAAGARRQWVSGVRGTGKSLAAAALVRARQAVAPARVHLILTPSQERADTLFADLSVLLGGDLPLTLFPSLEGLLYEETSPDFQLVRDRLLVLSRLTALPLSPALPPRGGREEMLVVIATPDAALHRTLPPAVMRAAARTLRVNEEVEPAALAAWLAEAGYAREALVEQPGQFSLRGGILDIFPSTAEGPVRLEFFGDFIESLRPFNPVSQRSHGALETLTLFPAREVLLTPERVAAALPAIREALQARLGEISHAPIRMPGEDGTEELLSPADRLTAKIGHETALLEQRAYFTGVEYYLPYLYPEGATLLDYLPADTAVVLDELEHQAHAIHRFREGLAQLEQSRLTRGALLPVPQPLYLALPDGLQQLAQFPAVALSLLPPGVDASFTDPAVKSEAPADAEEDLAPLAASEGGRDADLLDGAYLDLPAHPPSNYVLQPGQLQPDVLGWVLGQYAIVVATHQEHRLAEMLTGLGAPVTAGEAAQPSAAKPLPLGTAVVRRAELSEGIILPTAGIALLTDGEVLGWQKQRRTVRRQTQGQALAHVGQLTPGDYVVHINHGIGRYAGLVRREVLGIEREFLEIDYAGADKLFVPVDQLDRVQKYLGLDERPPEVHRLGGGDWERIRRRTKKSTEELAKQLLQLQALRSRQPGHAFAPDSPWQREMEEGFPWQETPDQLTAIRDVKVDMEAQHPMDRLVCGDVGYGKTEVAIRAAFKAVMDGMQVAVLAPTTVLAAQHFRNFRERMAAFPVRVGLLSRAVPRQEQNRIVGEVNGGAADIVIGTHRILSKDLVFKNLGLVIVDEEQRFGVKQKEHFKALAPNVDFLTMSATPIPRTLHMALSGLREMSLINTPPEGRMPVRTLAMEADDEVLREAILRELDRDGQVFVLHNRVSTITQVANRIRTIVPQARVEVGHGQMAEGELDRLMLAFYERKFDVFVCTTIIENGVDFPNANTLIVNDADTLGLAQLYQLRGRVGRSDRQAYAYLTWRPRKKLTDTAQQRIAALKEFAALGSGYRVALRDLEIRGAGDLLGAEQSGVLAAVGYDLYCQMLDEAVKLVKGEVVEPEPEVQIDLPIDALLPNSYVPDLNQRLDFYRRLAAVRNPRFAEELRAELHDRYGKPLPVEADNLFRLVAVKLRCRDAGVTHITTERGAIVLRLATERVLSPFAQRKLTLEAPQWRKRGLPAPGIGSGRVTVFTQNLDIPTTLDLLDEVLDRLRTIEEEAARPAKPRPRGW